MQVEARTSIPSHSGYWPYNMVYYENTGFPIQPKLEKLK